MNAEQFPLLTANVSGSYIKHLPNALAALSAALETGSILNPVYKDMKHVLSRCLDEAWRAVVNEKYTNAGKYLNLSKEEHTLTWDVSPQLHTIPGCIARVKKSKLDTPMTRDMLAFLNEVAPLGAAVVSMKDKIVKRQPKPVEDIKERYTAPSASPSAMKQVYDLLFAVTEESYDKLRQRFIDNMQSDMIGYLLECKKAEDKGEVLDAYKHLMTGGNTNRGLYSLVRATVEEGTVNFRTKAITPARARPDADKIIAEKATKMADAARDGFINKNLGKLDSIVEKKGNFAKVSLASREISLGGLRGSLLVEFADGSQFIAENNVVWNRSKYNEVFLQFPLRFVNPILADGKPMKMPSEKRMNTVFIGSDE